MSQLINLSFNDKSDLDAVVEAREKAAINRIFEGLEANGATDDQNRNVEALLGWCKPSGQALGSNAPLCRFAADRTAKGLHQFIPETSSIRCRLIALRDGQKPSPYNAIGIDLPAVKAKYLPYLKDEAANFLAVASPQCLEEGLIVQVNAFLWEAGGDSSTRERKARAGRKSKRPVHALEDDQPIACEHLALSAVAEHLWELPCVPDLDVRWRKKKRRYEASSTSEEQRQQELHGFIVRASTRLDGIAFGHGEGKVLLASVRRELKARAASLDLAGTALVPEAAIARALADLPASADGDRCILPAIKHLRS